jgi:dienelactone hydrolase
MTVLQRSGLTIVVGLGLLAAATLVQAQQELPPPQGKGRVVIVASGQSGAEHYHRVAEEIAKLGYDAVLFDGNKMENTHGEGLKTAIQQAQAMPHALPGKVAVVGFSLGGGIALYYGSQWPDQVAIDVAWYPATSMIKDVPGFAGRLQVPVLMLVGESDTYKNCCLVDKARELAAAAKEHNASFDLVTYPDTEHDYVIGGNHYNAKSYDDAFQRTSAILKQYLQN